MRAAGSVRTVGPSQTCRQSFSPPNPAPWRLSAWSGSGSDGRYKTGGVAADCGAWTSAGVGESAWYGFSTTTLEWLDRAGHGLCDRELHLYCFQVDHEQELDVQDFAQSGRRMFTASAYFDALLVADLIHPPGLQVTGTNANWRVFVGADAPNLPGSADSTCQGWSSTTGNAREGFAYGTATPPGDRPWFSADGGACASHTESVPVYCLEE